MWINYAGTTIAQEPSEGGLDAVQDFVAGDIKPLVDLVKFLRATSVTPFPRGNIESAITGKVINTEQPDVGSAMLMRASFLYSLPSKGTLTLIAAGKMLTFAGAVLGPCKVLRDQQGVAIGFSFTFYPAGPGVPSRYLTSQSDTPILGQSGVPIPTQQ